MGMERCTRCDKYVDLDWHVEEIIYVPAKDGMEKAVCVDCATEEELEAEHGG